jgi:hypothetical protein
MPTKTKTRTKTAGKPPSNRKADPKQFQRFVEAARKIGVDESPEALDRAFDKVSVSKSRAP